MAKQRIKTNIKKTYEKNKEKVLQYLADFLERGGSSFLEWIRQILKIKEKIRKVFVSVGLVFAGLVVLIIGLSNYLATLAPNLPAGVMHIIVGIGIIALAMVYVKV